MVKLVAEEGHWALYDNSMIFSNVIWEFSKKACRKYHLIDDERNELPFNLDECCQEVELPWVRWTREEKEKQQNNSSANIETQLSET